MASPHNGLWHTTREYVTHWTVAGAFLAATGAAPEHWIADLMQHVPLAGDHLPVWLEHTDYRLIAVVVGLTIIVGDTLWRNHRRAAPAHAPGNGAVSPAASAATERTPPPPVSGKYQQKVAFCRARDGARLAYAIAGEGPKLVKAGGFLSHIQEDWDLWGHIWANCAEDHTFLRYDPRGTGLSDWETGELSFDAWVSDLETVVDAAGFERFPLLGISQGCAISVAYAARHPERVSHLILLGGFAIGLGRGAVDEKERERIQATVSLMRTGWDDPSSAFRQIFTTMLVPEANKAQRDAVNDLLLKVSSPGRAGDYQDIVNDIDVSHLLGQVQTPTLVMHLREDALIPVALGRQLAAGIPGARFLALPGKNHVFMRDEPAFDLFFSEMRAFLRS